MRINWSGERERVKIFPPYLQGDIALLLFLSFPPNGYNVGGGARMEEEESYVMKDSLLPVD